MHRDVSLGIAAFRKRETGMKAFTQTLALSLALAAAASAHADGPDPTHDGWVSHVDDHRLEICYRDNVPAIGETLQILRVSYPMVNKTLSRQQFQLIGKARITASSSNRCVIGELIQGTAERTNHVRAVATASAH